MMTNARSTLSTLAYRGCLTAMAVAVLLLAVSPAALPAQVPADSVLRDFQPTGDYLLFIDGAEVPTAEIYTSRRAAALLILTSAFESPVMLNPGQGRVESVNLMKVVKKQDGSIDILADATLENLGSFRLDGGEILFTAYGKEARLEPKPPLVGSHDRSDLVSHSPEYLQGATSYQPSSRALDLLRQQGQAVEVRVYFGSWCSVCKRYLPNVLRVEEELDGSKVDFEYYGLDRPPDGWNDPEVKRAGVKSVPTGIVYVGGREAGRISTPAAWSKVESSLASIVRSVGSSTGR